MCDSFCESWFTKDIETVMEKLFIANSFQKKIPTGLKTITTKEKVLMSSTVVSSKTVPNTVGMGLKDAMYLLENNGLNVVVIGRGSVTKQSIAAGTKINKGTQIVIELS